MLKQEDFNKLFLEKNKDLDREIAKEWEDVLFSDYMKSLYEKVDNFFNLELVDKEIDFYQGEDIRYVLEISSSNPIEQDKNGETYIDSSVEYYQNTFQIWFREDGITYELHDYAFEVYTTEEALYELPCNGRKIAYTKQKAKFLEWSKENKYKVLEVIKNRVKEEEDEKESKQIKKDIKELENIKW